MKKIFWIIAFLGASIQADQWYNWAKNQACSAKIVTPKNTQELVDIIKKASKEEKTIRPFGSGHSWSNIVCNEGYIVDTKHLKKIKHINKRTHEVTVQAGIKINELNKKLAEHNLCLPNQAAITEQSLAGNVSTATHGTGKTGTFASFITKVKLITTDGSIKTFSEIEHSSLFPAVRTSIGSLGIMTELTIQCEPLFYVKRSKKTLTWKEALIDYEKILAENDFMQMYWDGLNDSVEVLMANRMKNKKEKIKANASYNQLTGDVSPYYMEEEIAIPRTKFKQAAAAARDLVKNNLKKNKMFTGILFRFVSAEKNNLLSPAADCDVVYFSITTTAKNGYEPFYKEFYKTMLAYDGRPHWGKLNYLDKKDTQTLYGYNYRKFIKIRKKLDPKGRFSNAFTKKIFGW